MKKNILIILFLFFTLCSLGKHKDQIIYQSFGNVQTIVKTGFLNYGEIEQVEIFGKLAQILSERLKYKDTIIVDFWHDYTFHGYPKLLIIDNGKINPHGLLNDLEKIKENQEKWLSHGNTPPGICFSITDTKFDINKHLKLLEYCLQNKIENSLNKVFFKPDYGEYDEVPMIEINYYGLTDSQIQEILNQPNSNTFLEISKLKVAFTSNELPIKGVYENGSFTFYFNNSSYKIENLIYLIEGKKGVFIFDSENTFVYLNNESNEIKNHRIKSEGYYPFYASGYNHIDNSNPVKDGEVFLYRAMSGDWAIYSIEKNKIIKKNK